MEPTRQPLGLIRAAALAAAMALTLPAQAQSPDPAPGGPPPEEGVDMIERGAGILFRHLFNQMAPEIDGISRDLSDAMQLLGPALTDLATLVDDIQNYETPERQDNGDIIIRRKPDAPPPPPIGEGLRNFTEPQDSVPIDHDQPQVEL